MSNACCFPVLLSINVQKARGFYESYFGLVPRFVYGLRDEAWGQRHFMLRGPDGVFVDVIERIAPADEYAAGYTGAEP